MTNQSDDLAEIQQAVFRYARGLDRFHPEEAASAFTDEPIWDATAVGQQRYEGRQVVLDFFIRDAASMSEQYHAVTNVIVEFDGPNDAHGTNYVLFEGRTRSGANIKAAVFNEDKYHRTDKGWRIAERVISPLTEPRLEAFEA